MVSLENYTEELLTYDKPKDALEAYIRIYVKDQADGKRVMHKNVAVKKIVGTALYAVLGFLILSIYAFYRNYDFSYGASLLACITIIWFFTSWLFFTNEKSLLNKIKKMPDAEIDGVLASESDNCWNAFKVYGIEAAIIGGTLLLSLLLYFKPHMIFEKNDAGYSLRYYTRAINEESKVVIPDTYKGEPVTEIRGTVFFGTKSMREIELPKGLKEIRGSTFEKCENLERVVIPEGVIRIGGRAFSDCLSLKSVTLPSTIQTINGSAFRECVKLREINLPEGLTKIGDYAFHRCCLTGVTIPSTVQYIGDSAFRCCPLFEVTLPEGPDKIGDNAFRYCLRLKSVTISGTVLTIGSGAFRDCHALEKVTFVDPASVGGENSSKGNRTVGRTAFRSCALLEEIILPEGYTEIGENAFRDCTKLSHVGIPSTMKYLDRYAFRGCTSLDEIVLPKGCRQGERVFRDTNTDVKYE